MVFVHIDNSDQPGHLPSLTSHFTAECSLNSLESKLSLYRLGRLVRLGGHAQIQKINTGWGLALDQVGLNFFYHFKTHNLEIKKWVQTPVPLPPPLWTCAWWMPKLILFFPRSRYKHHNVGFTTLQLINYLTLLL